MSKAQLERAVLSDPGITIYALRTSGHRLGQGRQAHPGGAGVPLAQRAQADGERTALRPGPPHRKRHALGGLRGDAVEISAINGIAIAGHQGAGTITDLTIRTLLSLPGEFVPHEIVSLMRYPGAPNTHARAADWAHIHLDYLPRTAVALSPAAAASVAHSARSGHAAPPPVVSATALSGVQWQQLFTQIGGLSQPKIAGKPSSAAIPDPKHH